MEGYHTCTNRKSDLQSNRSSLFATLSRNYLATISKVISVGFCRTTLIQIRFRSHDKIKRSDFQSFSSFSRKKRLVETEIGKFISSKIAPFDFVLWPQGDKWSSGLEKVAYLCQLSGWYKYIATHNFLLVKKYCYTLHELFAQLTTSLRLTDIRQPPPVKPAQCRYCKVTVHSKQGNW